MKIDIYTQDQPLSIHLAEAWHRAFAAWDHEALIMWSPMEGREKIDLGFEIGTRHVRLDVGAPMIHYVIDPLEDGRIPIEWIKAATDRGHLFFFVDQTTQRRAHQQGIRMAKYLPLAGDSLVPYTPAKEPAQWDVGYFGDPDAPIVEMLQQVRSIRPDWKVAVWGVQAKWGDTPLADHWAGDIPVPGKLLNTMDLCRFVLDDPRYNFAGYFFLQAIYSNAIALAPHTGERWDLFEQGRFLYAPQNMQAVFGLLSDTGSQNDVRNNQRLALGHVEGSAWREKISIKTHGYKHNRFVDRVQCLMDMLEEGNLYENAKKCCKDGTLEVVKPADDDIVIRLGWPSKDNKADFCLDGNGFDLLEVPTLLRLCARRVEEKIVDGTFEKNTIQVVKNAI